VQQRYRQADTSGNSGLPVTEVTPGVMYVGVGANTGKTVFTRSHCRLLSDRGLRVSPFKPVAVSKRQETRNHTTLDYRLWVLGAAARCQITDENSPVLVLRTGAASGMLTINGQAIGSLPLMAADTPLFNTEITDLVLSAISASYASLASRSDVVIIEGSGSCADLVDRLDPANTFVAALAAPAVVLIAGVQSGGAVAALRGTWSQLPEQMRELVVGFALNDVSAGAAILEKGAQKAADEAGVTFLGSLPHCHIYDDVPAGQTSALGDSEREYDRMAELFSSHLDLAAIDRAIGLET
jgi:adenosylcobyric acid synthase